MFSFDDNFYITVCVIALLLSILIGTAYDTAKENQCNTEAMKAGIAPTEIVKICRY